MAEFRMPSLGADMEAGTLRAWRCKVGDRLQRGDIVAEVETEKGIVEVETFTAGVLERFLVEPGVKVPVGTPLAMIDSDTTREAPAIAPEVVPPMVQATPSARRRAREAGVEITDLHGTGRHGSVTGADVDAASTAPHGPELQRRPEKVRVGGRGPKVSPYARARAAKLGVALETASPTGPDGSVVAADVERAAAQRSASSKTGETKAAMRRAIAASMARSKREIPHYYLSHTVDLADVLERLRADNERRAVEARIVPGLLFLRAVIAAAKKYPDFNAHWNGTEAPPVPDVHLGVAISLRGGGLVSPAILSADRLDTDGLMSAFKDLVERARKGALRATEMSSPTLTVTSLGERGVEAVFPIIVPPQVAMVGFGTIVQRPFVVDGAVLARPVVTVTLAADHRVTDGHRGGLFLAEIARALAKGDWS